MSGRAHAALPSSGAGASGAGGGLPFDLPIIDAHQHFWDIDANYLPWLCDEPLLPFRYGDYSPLRRNYLPADYARDTHGFNVVGTVFVETEWDRLDPIGETRWVHALAGRHGLPSAMVAYAPLDHDDAAAILAGHARFPLTRGIRHKPRAAPAPDRIAPGSMSDPAWRAGFARLEEHGFSFDLQTPWWHLPEALALATDFPATTIILDHAGLPADRSAAGLSGWREAMRRLAEAPNVAVKVSGLGEAGRSWSLERNRAIILDIIAMFGEDRVMFASNFPVDSLVGDFRTIYEGLFAASAALGRSTQEKLFAGNARRYYRIDP